MFQVNIVTAGVNDVSRLANLVNTAPLGAAIVAWHLLSEISNGNAGASPEATRAAKLDVNPAIAQVMSALQGN